MLLLNNLNIKKEFDEPERKNISIKKLPKDSIKKMESAIKRSSREGPFKELKTPKRREDSSEMNKKNLIEKRIVNPRPKSKYKDISLNLSKVKEFRKENKTGMKKVEENLKIKKVKKELKVKLPRFRNEGKIKKPPIESPVIRLFGNRIKAKESESGENKVKEPLMKVQKKMKPEGKLNINDGNGLTNELKLIVNNLRESLVNKESEVKINDIKIRVEVIKNLKTELTNQLTITMSVKDERATIFLSQTRNELLVQLSATSNELETKIENSLRDLRLDFRDRNIELNIQTTQNSKDNEDKRDSSSSREESLRDDETEQQQEQEEKFKDKRGDEDGLD